MTIRQPGTKGKKAVPVQKLFQQPVKAYAFPLIGAKPVREVEQRDVLAVLAPIWTDKPETARRVRSASGR